MESVFTRNISYITGMQRLRNIECNLHITNFGERRSKRIRKSERRQISHYVALYLGLFFVKSHPKLLSLVV